MKKNFIKRFWSRSTLTLLLVGIYLISFTYTSGVYALRNTGTDPMSIDYWDGKDNYTSLDNVLGALEKDANGWYHITEASQLHAVIKYNGGGNKYKLDNNLYLNENYGDYSTWDVNPPSNNWDFTSAASASPSYSFSGTIDGCGYTIYGMYCNGAKNFYSGLIGTVGNTTIVKNLNMRNLYIKASNFSGAIIGGNWYSSPSTMTISITGCTVRDAYFKDVWNNGAAGGLIGLTTRPTTIKNCAAIDVKFKSATTATDVNPYGCMGSFVGSLYASTNSNTNVYQTNQGKTVIISNSYAVNVVNTSNGNAPVYVSGIYREGTSTKWNFCITAQNVYTDATEVSANTAGTVKLLVSDDGVNGVYPTDANYPIKQISAEDIKGENAKIAMPTLDWKAWKTSNNDFPYFVDNTPANVWDGTDSYTSLANVLEDLGAADSDGYYHIKTTNQLHAVIKYNGGGNKYKLDNDLYLNADYENSANWSFGNAPANEWAFNSSSWTNPQYKFYGTIDGCGHTVYGLYSNNDSAYNGLIGTVYDTTVIKNLNVWHSYVRSVRSAGILIGGNFYNSPSTTTITVEGCSVRYATIDNVWNNAPSGGIIGVTTRKTTVNNCSVADVKFTSGSGNAADNNRFGCFGSFVGALYASTSDATSLYNSAQGKCININNSYAVNVVNASNNNAPVYVCGLYAEGAKWCFSITANNVYTDATTVTTNTDGTVKLLVSTDGQTEIKPTNSKYPIKRISADEIIGDVAKAKMPAFDWCEWSTVQNDYPTPQGSHSLSHVSGIPASCTSGGTAEYWCCIECNKKFSDAKGENEISSVGTVEPINHKNAEHHTEKEVSCTENGNIEYWYCPDCEKYSTNQDFTELCEQAVVIIPKTNHTGGKMHYTETSATCEEDGHIEYWHCTDCDKYFTDEACSNEVEKSAVITGLATGHKNPVFRESTPAGNTCIESGTISHYECLDCNKYFEDEECTIELISIDAPSDRHASKRVSEKAATCYMAGVREHYECIYCHKYFEDEDCKNQVTISNLTIPAIAHKNAKYSAKALPSCTTVGLKEHWHCFDCDGYFTKESLSEADKVAYSTLVIAANGHETSGETVMEYDDKKHWQLCDTCSAEINHKAHELSQTVSVYDGSEKRCECGYALQKFDVELSRINISSDYGVFDYDTTLSVQNIKSGTSYDKIVSAIVEEVDDLKIYEISAKKGSLKVLPKGKVKISLPVSKSYSGNVAVYSIDENGSAKKLNADFKREDAIANLELYGLGTFVVADLGVTSDMLTINGDSQENTESNENSANTESNSNSEIPNTGDSSGLQIFIVVAVVAGFILITGRTVVVIRNLKSRKVI